MLLPYPIGQPARSRELAFVVAASVNVAELQNYFVLSNTAIGTRNCAVNMRSVDLDS